MDRLPAANASRLSKGGRRGSTSSVACSSVILQVISVEMRGGAARKTGHGTGLTGSSLHGNRRRKRVKRWTRTGRAGGEGRDRRPYEAPSLPKVLWSGETGRFTQGEPRACTYPGIACDLAAPGRWPPRRGEARRGDGSRDGYIPPWTPAARGVGSWMAISRRGGTGRRTEGCIWRRGSLFPGPPSRSCGMEGGSWKGVAEDCQRRISVPAA